MVRGPAGIGIQKISEISEISGGSENPSFAPNAVHGLGLGFGVSPHVSLW